MGLRATTVQVIVDEGTVQAATSYHQHIGPVQLVQITRRCEGWKSALQDPALRKTLKALYVLFPLTNPDCKMLDKDSSIEAVLLLKTHQVASSSTNADAYVPQLHVRRGVDPIDTCRALLSSQGGLEMTLRMASRRQAYWIAVGSRARSAEVPVHVLILIAVKLAMLYVPDLSDRPGTIWR